MTSDVVTPVATQPVLHELDFRLSYGDCDPAGIVFFAAYYQWFERVFNEWAFLGGFKPSSMRELWGASHVSVSSGCRYFTPGKLHDPFTCRMRLGHVGNTSFSMKFGIEHRENAVTYAEGQMTFVFVDEADPPRPVPVPEGLKTTLRQLGCTL